MVKKARKPKEYVVLYVEDDVPLERHFTDLNECGKFFKILHWRRQCGERIELSKIGSVF